MPDFLPLSRPHLTGREEDAVRTALASGTWAGNGPHTKTCQLALERMLGTAVRLTSSGSTALDIAALALGCDPGAEVIVPSYTFVATATAFVSAGYVPVFADVNPATANIDPESIARVMSSRTRAIVPVHYAGVAADMDAIVDFATQHGLAVIEDAAQGLGATYRGRPLGAIGDVGILSFHQTKHVTCGEGGAVVVANDDYLERVDVAREIGTDRARFLRGEIRQYSWIGRGSNFLLSDLLAAVLAVQLDSLSEIIAKRRALYDRYTAALEPIARRGPIRMARIPPACQPNYQSFHIFARDVQTRRRLEEHLRARNISCGSHYRPLHLTKGGKALGIIRGALPGSEEVGECLFRVPFYTSMTAGDVDRVCAAIGETLAGT